jgi:predicted alpha/beta-fold hydrolase
MGANLQNVVKRHASALSKDPDTLMAKCVTATLAIKKPRLDEVDHTITRFVGGTSPPFPFDSLDDYYIWASSHKVLGDIRVPFLTLNSADDPIVRSVPTDCAGNGYVAISLTLGGGHLGWFEAGDRIGEVKRWIKKPVLEWLRAFGEDVIHEGQRGLSLHEVDGFLKEVGRDDIGCKEVDDEAGLVVGAKGQEGLLSGL